MDLDGYVDQVARKEQFLADHPDVTVTVHPEAPPWAYWQGHVSGFDAITSGELGHVLDRLVDQVAIRDVHARWPNWAFTHTISGWQARETDGPELFVGRTFELVEARVAQHERISKGRRSGD